MIIQNGMILTPFEMHRGIDVLIRDGRISALIEHSARQFDDQVIDVHGCYVFPGLVDIHTHGCMNSDFMDATEADFRNILSFQASHGVTSVLGSTITAPVDQIVKALDCIRHYKGHLLPGSRLLGAHVEGPYLSEIHKGAHCRDYLRIPERDGFGFLLDNADIISNVTCAPELRGSIEMIKALVDKQLIVSGGHDDAKEDDVFRAIDAGMTNATHIFCAMSGLRKCNGKRHVGMSEISLLSENMSVEMIADNHHLPPLLSRLIYRCKGADNACIVSDCVRAGGLPADGTVYKLGSRDAVNRQEIVIDDDVAVLLDRSFFAGSVQQLDHMLRNLVFDCEIPLADAVKMATSTPARIIHKDDFIGSIAPGMAADLCIMDTDLNVVKTIIDGAIEYES
jgi:N-acetylglucosamine-6-phosphate deacetylase